MPFCVQCGKLISSDAVFCPSCGRKVQASSPSPTPSPVSPPPAQTAPPVGVTAVTESKNPGNAALIAIVLGIIGFFGIGHVYVGRIGRGVVLLIGGLALRVLLFFSLFFLLGISKSDGDFLLPMELIFLGVANLAVFIWQTYDAYRLAKQFNAHVQQYGKAPW